jgi:hypothetical protein
MSNNPEPESQETGNPADLVEELKKRAEDVPEEPAGNPAYDFPTDDGQDHQDDIDTSQTASDEAGPDQSEDQKRKSCKQMVKLGDQGQQALFAWLYRRAYFTDRQWERVSEMPEQGSDPEDQQDAELRKLYKQYQQQLQSLPLTQEEINDLTDHAKEAMDYLEKQPPSPVTALVIAVLSTLGVRAMPLIINDNG